MRLFIYQETITVILYRIFNELLLPGKEPGIVFLQEASL